MQITSQRIIDEIQAMAKPERAKDMLRYFKCAPGEYGEGDIFIGLTNPEIRSIAKKFYRAVSIDQMFELLRNPIHDIRMNALVMLTEKFAIKRTSHGERKQIVDLYIQHIPHINNWDLVDVSAHKILGPWYFEFPDNTLEKLANDDLLWANRVAMIATFHHIRKASYDLPLQIATILLHHKHDLIHKAVGWMLREIGKKDLDVEIGFLRKHYQTMPRTMLRYAIEKFEEPLRKAFLKGIFEVG
jgi:3-methyladenine DNA glycosylase AlkD